MVSSDSDLGPVIDKSKMKDPTTGNFITQGLFLEHKYDTNTAVFTLKDDDFEYEGVIYPSLKRLFLEKEDLGEYDFACEVLLGWKHWQRICNNKLFSKLIDEWRKELEIKMRGRAIRNIANAAEGKTPTAIAAAKWMADKGWSKRAAGRPSTEDVQRETEIAAGIAADYKADVVRMSPE